jgi:hypothetical protein
MPDLLLALLLYPGMATLVVLGVLWGTSVEKRLPALAGLRHLGSAEGLLTLISLGLASIALTLAPWPFHPDPQLADLQHVLLIWALLEGAFVLPLLPTLVHSRSLATWAAWRELQIGVAGRVVVWFAIIAAIWLGGSWTLLAIPGRLVLLIAAVVALPAATGIGVFGPDRALTPDGADDGLPAGLVALLRFGRYLRSAALIALLAVATFALAPFTPTTQALLMVGVLLLLIAVLPRLMTNTPRLTTLSALDWCCQRALPLATLAFVYLAVISI